MRYDYDIIVVGAGHAGCEAALAASRLGADTLLITADMNRVAQMSCNPAVGGIAKGQIVREIDALGGEMGIIADRTAIQFRMLNRSKGPAVWSPRVQSDRTAYIDEWRRTLDAAHNLSMFQDLVNELVIEDNLIQGVKTALGLTFRAKKVILTVGTFLNGLMHFGKVKVEGGRISEVSSTGLTEQLVSLGFRAGRMKTGTPMRIDGASIDLSQVDVQRGDDVSAADRDFHKFSFLPEVHRVLAPRDCYIVHTNPEVHDTLRASLADSPMYNGDIQSVGPRYCPSIETKIVTFAEKDSHQLFLEPEGETTREFYVNGFSSSLPWQTQFDAIQHVPGLENVQIYRPGYAIEYDYFDPTDLTHDMQTKLVPGLYFAGQINGTTGYEEAAAQGLMAGINAARALKDLEPIVLGRDRAYIGVLLDDLVTKGVDEPYRMFTSRAEYRILLRQDDADMRLTPLGYEIGLASRERFDAMESKRAQRDALVAWCSEHSLRATPEVNAAMDYYGSSQLGGSVRFVDLLKRPQLNFARLRELSPMLEERLQEVEESRREEIIEAAEILIKYEGYITRERDLAEKASRLEGLRLPRNIDYSTLTQLSTEARQKLAALRPVTLGQASRIPGVSPADISVLLLLMNR